MSIAVRGLGSYLPGPPRDQAAVRRFLRRYPDSLTEASQERVLAESGIMTRHYGIDIDDETRRETNTSLAVTAGRRALAAAGWRPEDVDLLVVTTVVPDQLMPPTSTLVQEALGISQCAEIEISANCSAPFKGLAFAAAQVELGAARRALICTVQFSSFLGRPPWSNADHMVENDGMLRWIVSDGAGAMAIERGQPDVGMRTWFESAGIGERSGMSLALGAAYPDLATSLRHGAHHVIQDDRYVLRAGVRHALAAIPRMLRSLGVDPGDIDHFIPAVSGEHLAETLKRLVGERCGIRADVWRMNLSRVGYLGGVGFILVLEELLKGGTLRPGELVCGFAVESSKWMAAGCVLRWQGYVRGVAGGGSAQ